MPPTVALLLWFVLLLALLYFDAAKGSGTSIAIWVPLIWMFIAATRLPSQWFAGEMQAAANTLEEGNSLDRTILSILILLAIGILISRSFNWGDFFVRNLALMAFVTFALASVFWSDFPFIAFKRWFRDLGNYLMILVVLSETNQLEAVRTFLRRTYYLTIPLSVLLIRYYSDIGIHYSVYTGAPEYVGVATSKNTLGVLCMLSGIFFFWDTLTRWSKRKVGQNKRAIFVNLIFFVMMLWLLNLASSATSGTCLAIGCLLIAVAHTRWSERHPAFLKVLMPASFCLYIFLAFGLGLSGNLASQVGRDPTLTGRTVIWDAVLSTNTNPLIGTGYASFWLGPRLERVWAMTGAGINEAHNGYLDVYLNMGYIGLFLVGLLLIVSYRRICRDLNRMSSLASLSAAFWTIALFYNMTEASFTPTFMCFTFLLGTVIVPGRQLGRQAAELESFRTNVLTPERAKIPSFVTGPRYKSH